MLFDLLIIIVPLADHRILAIVIGNKLRLLPMRFYFLDVLFDNELSVGNLQNIFGHFDSYFQLA